MSYARRYASQQAETASPERLMVLLCDRALQHMRAAAAALEAGRRREAGLPIAKASQIVAELSRTLDARRAPELAAHLQQTYLFVSQRLLAAGAGLDSHALRQAERVFEPVASAFSEAVRASGVAR